MRRRLCTRWARRRRSWDCSARIAHYGRTGGSSLIRAQVKQYLVWFIISGLLFPGIDNFAHLGGFLGGYAASALLNPLARERGDHLIIAIGCLVATLLAIVTSVVTGLALAQAHSASSAPAPRR